MITTVPWQRESSVDVDDRVARQFPAPGDPRRGFTDQTLSAPPSPDAPVPGPGA